MTRFPYEAVFSGEEIHTLNLAGRLREKGYEIIFAGSCPVLLTRFREIGFQSKKRYGGKALVSKQALLLFLFTFPLVLISFLFLAIEAKWKDRVDVVYMLSLNEKLFLTPWLLFFGIRVVWVEHSRIGDWLTKNPFLRFYLRWSNFIQIVTVSQLAKVQLLDLGVPFKNIKFILNGVDVVKLNEFNQNNLDKWVAQNQFFKSNSFKIGLITRLYADKGIDYFIEAFRQVIIHFPNCEALIVGEGPEKELLASLAKNLPIRFIGKLEHAEIKYFLQSIDVFVLPSSEYDPFGLAPAEAMATKKPVIVTDVCGITDFLQNEEEALIVPAKNVEALSDALKRLINDEKLRKKLAQNGQKLAQRKFSLERMVDEYEEVIA